MKWTYKYIILNYLFFFLLLFIMYWCLNHRKGYALHHLLFFYLRLPLLSWFLLQLEVLGICEGSVSFLFFRHLWVFNLDPISWLCLLCLLVHFSLSLLSCDRVLLLSPLSEFIYTFWIFLQIGTDDDVHTFCTLPIFFCALLPVLGILVLLSRLLLPFLISVLLLSYSSIIFQWLLVGLLSLNVVTLYFSLVSLDC